jgi:UTP pyrophosphatase
MHEVSDLPYLRSYPETVLQRVRALLASGELAPYLARKYPESHQIQSDKALYVYAQEIKNQYLRNVPPLAKVSYDSRLSVLQNALGLNTAISRVQGGKLTAKSEIRVSSLLKNAPAPFLRMIVVHELAHLKERNHDKAFYQLCQHMEPDYLQLEFDFRLHLTLKDG